MRESASKKVKDLLGTIRVLVVRGDGSVSAFDEISSRGVVGEIAPDFFHAFREAGEVLCGFSFGGKGSGASATSREKEASGAGHFEVAHDQAVRLAIDDALLAQDVETDR